MPGLSQTQINQLASSLQNQYGWTAQQAQNAAQSVNTSYNASANRFNYNSNYNVNNSTQNGMNGLANNAFNVAGQIVGGITNTLFNSLQDESQGQGNRIGVETAKGILGGIQSSIGSLMQGNVFGTITNLLNTVTQQTQKMALDIGTTNKQLYEVVNQNGTFVGQMAEHMRDETYRALSLATSYGMSTSDFMSSIDTMNKSSGRMVLYTKEAIESGVRASVAFTSSSKTLLENTENFRNVGYGIEDAAKKIEEAGKRTLTLGLNAKVLGDTLVKNIGKLNEFGFKNGIDGLSNMAREAQSLNLNMENTFKIASDLYDPNKALDMSANLAMIGGAVGDFGDPLRMIYDVTNNVEGLQSSLIKAAKGLATYNEQQGKFEVTGANLRRAKLMADTFGISMGELTNLAVKANVQFQAMREINLLPNVNEDQKEFLKNISTIKDGKIGIYLPESLEKKFNFTGLDKHFLTLSELSSKGKDIQEALLKEQKKISEMSAIDIARDQYTEIGRITNILSAWYIQSQIDIRDKAKGTDLGTSMKLYAEKLSKLDPKQAAFGQSIIDGLQDAIKQTPLVKSATPNQSQPEMKISANQANIPNPNLQNQQTTNTNNTNNTPTETTVNQKVDVVIRGSGDMTNAITRYWSKNIHELSVIGVKTDNDPKTFGGVKKLAKK